jgi:transmembrane sensor
LGVTSLFIHILVNLAIVTKPELLALIDKYVEGKASQEEIDLLSRYYNSFQQKLNWDESELGSRAETESNVYNRIRDQIKREITDDKTDINAQPGKVFRLNQRRTGFTFKSIAVAAGLIGLLALVTWLLVIDDSKKELVTTENTQNASGNDVPPGGNKALLTLADGSTIVLDDVQNGTLARQGNTRVTLRNGRLNYEAAGLASNQILYNTVSTPVGGQYQLVLPDGSLVWLNSASSIRFPTAFEKASRRVEISGEAYFDIKSLNKSLERRGSEGGKGNVPFIVKINTPTGNGGQVEVLGTHFNINAYGDEYLVETTLLEGAVKFVNENSAHILSPGQQSQLLKTGQTRVIANVETENVVAWKNGFFHFEGDDIISVGRQISRWYGVEVEVTDKVNERFYAEIPRNTNLSDVLKALELTGKVRFEIEGRRIKVFP